MIPWVRKSDYFYHTYFRVFCLRLKHKLNWTNLRWILISVLHDERSKNSITITAEKGYHLLIILWCLKGRLLEAQLIRKWKCMIAPQQGHGRSRNFWAPYRLSFQCGVLRVVCPRCLIREVKRDARERKWRANWPLPESAALTTKALSEEVYLSSCPSPGKRISMAHLTLPGDW